ncbi:MAG: tandem-95 repeat protein, partial [Planctomycetes bacterium]|nr:tandem-95 repeat protein [Planctomycetota bacterium]
IQSDGKIVVAGSSHNGSNYDFALTRYNSNGSLDTTFDGDGKVTTAIGSSGDFAYSLAIQSDTKIVVAGHSLNGGYYDFAVTRYNSNGSLDATFDGDGKVTTAVGSFNDYANSVAIQNDGKIVVAGGSFNGSNRVFALARYNSEFNQNPTDISLSWAVFPYKVTDLGTLGGVGVDPRGINNNGQVVGLSGTAAGDSRAFSYIDGPMMNLGTLGGTHSEASGVNNSGQVVGYSTAANGSDRAFLYSGGVMQDIGTLGGSSSRAFSVNSSGQIVGYSDTGTEGHAFLYTGGTMQDLGTLGGSSSRAYGVNDSGQVVGESSTESHSPRAFLYSNGSMQDLGTINGQHSIARAINNSGQVVGSSTVGGGQYWHAFLYENGSMQDLGTLGGTTSHANDINNLGQVVGQASSNVDSHAFLYSSGVMWNLQDMIDPASGWRLGEARGINDNGWIVGWGMLDGESGSRAFLLSPVVPTSIAENAGINATVGTLSTTDPDAGDTFTYCLVTGTDDTDNGAFNISGNSLRATNSFNFEAKSIYTVRVRSTDQGGLFTEKAFTISVTDVNEAPTDIALSSSTIAENADANAVIGALSTIDPDAGNTFTYTLVSGTGSTDNGAFNISDSNLRATSSFDFESKSSYTIRIRSTDQAGLFTEKTFTITVTDINESPTNISLSSNTIAENSAANSPVGTLSTSDPDAGNTFTYALVTGSGDTDNDSFNISGNGLRATSTFNFETKSSYTVRVRSTDQGGLFTEKVFVITVTNTLESPNDIRFSSSGPLIDFVINGSIESPAVVTETQFYNGQTIGSGWTVISGNTAYIIRDAANLGTSPFGTQFLEIHGDTVGQLISGLIPGSTYTLSYYVTLSTIPSYLGDGRITASIAGQSEIFDYSLFGNHLFGSAAFPWTKRSLSFIATSSSELLVISGAGALNQNPFVAIDNISVISSAPENMGANSPIGVLESTDPDLGSSLIYSLVAGEDDADNAKFIIDGSTLKSIANLDFESQSRFTIRVRATDQDGLFTEEPFVINVMNVNEPPTDISLSQLSIAENSGANSTIGTFTTSDVDIGDTFVYSLVAGSGDTDNAAFNVSGSTLRATSSFDFETKSSYTVRIRSMDQGGLFVEKVFAIRVVNVNDPPIAVADSYWISVGTPQMLDVLVNDSDIDSLIDPTSIEIVRPPSHGTAIPMLDGTVRFIPDAGYRGVDGFTYRVSDSLGLFSNDATVQLRVNSAPNTTPDSLVVKQTITTVLDVLRNDSDPDGTLDPATLVIVSGSDVADVVVQSNGTIRFTPRAGFLGTTQFRYVVSDNDGRPSVPTDVTVRVVVS